MVYATYSEGFRVGGSNPLKPSSILPRDFTSDTLKNYELGAKTEWLDNRLRFNVAVYSMDWDDFAVQIEDPQAADETGASSSAYVNLPSAEIPGVEAEFTFVVNDAWQIDATLGYNDARGVRGDRADARGRPRPSLRSAGARRARVCRSRRTGPRRSASNGGRAASS